MGRGNILDILKSSANVQPTGRVVARGRDPGHKHTSSFLQKTLSAHRGPRQALGETAPWPGRPFSPTQRPSGCLESRTGGIQSEASLRGNGGVSPPRGGCLPGTPPGRALGSRDGPVSDTPRHLQGAASAAGSLGVPGALPPDPPAVLLSATFRAEGQSAVRWFWRKGAS